MNKKQAIEILEKHGLAGSDAHEDAELPRDATAMAEVNAAFLTIAMWVARTPSREIEEDETSRNFQKRFAK